MTVTVLDDGWLVEEKRPRARHRGQRVAEMTELRKDVSREVPQDYFIRQPREVRLELWDRKTTSGHVHVVRDPKNRRF